MNIGLGLSSTKERPNPYPKLSNVEKGDVSVNMKEGVERLSKDWLPRTIQKSWPLFSPCPSPFKKVRFFTPLPQPNPRETQIFYRFQLLIWVTLQRPKDTLEKGSYTREIKKSTCSHSWNNGIVNIEDGFEHSCSFMLGIKEKTLRNEQVCTLLFRENNVKWESTHEMLVKYPWSVKPGQNIWSVNEGFVDNDTM